MVYVMRFGFGVDMKQDMQFWRSSSEGKLNISDLAIRTRIALHALSCGQIRAFRVNPT